MIEETGCGVLVEPSGDVLAKVIQDLMSDECEAPSHGRCWSSRLPREVHAVKGGGRVRPGPLVAVESSTEDDRHPTGSHERARSAAMTLPTFVGIGVARGGTTWLHTLLSGHPRVFMPTHRKEIRFFDRNYDRGLGWYEAFFPESADVDAYDAIGEISPQYLYCSECPERVAATLPAAKLIVILRHPVDRAYSHYGFVVQRRNFQGSFEEFLAMRPNMLEKGFYSRSLDRYVRYFDRDRILAIVFEKAVRDDDAARKAPLDVPRIAGRRVPPVHRQGQRKQRAEVRGPVELRGDDRATPAKDAPREGRRPRCSPRRSRSPDEGESAPTTRCRSQGSAQSAICRGVRRVGVPVSHRRRRMAALTYVVASGGGSAQRRQV